MHEVSASGGAPLNANIVSPTFTGTGLQAVQIQGLLGNYYTLTTVIFTAVVRITPYFADPFTLSTRNHEGLREKILTGHCLGLFTALQIRQNACVFTIVRAHVENADATAEAGVSRFLYEQTRRPQVRASDLPLPIRPR